VTGARLTDNFVEIAGARLWTATTGTGPAVVLLHGGPGGHDDLEFLASMIDDAYQVHRFDQRACGRSSGGPPFTAERWLRDLEALREHWGHDRWIVGGHSFGAEIALAYAVTHPHRTDALIYMSCLPEFEAGEAGVEEYRTNRLARIPEDLRDRWLTLRAARESGSEEWSPDEYVRIGMLTDFHDPMLAREYTERWLRIPVNDEVNAQLAEDFRTYFADPRVLDGIRRFDRPALLLHGEDDPRPLWAVEWLAGQLPNARFERLPGGHIPWIEAPGELRDALRSFMSSLDDPKHDRGV